jgi:hypothetical protein
VLAWVRCCPSFAPGHPVEYRRKVPRGDRHLFVRLPAVLRDRFAAPVFYSFWSMT